MFILNWMKGKCAQPPENALGKPWFPVKDPLNQPNKVMKLQPWLYHILQHTRAILYMATCGNC